MGNATISTFPKIMDCIDVVEELARIYNEDFWSKRDNLQKKNIVDISIKSKELIDRLYPLFYSDKFVYTFPGFCDSMIGNEDVYRKRKELIEAALRYNVSGAKKQVQESLEQMTSFKPFNIKELFFDVWESKPKI